VILTCHSYVTVYIYPRYSHLKSLASYFGLQVSRTHFHVYLSFLLRTLAVQSLIQTIRCCVYLIEAKNLLPSFQKEQDCSKTLRTIELHKISLQHIVELFKEFDIDYWVQATVYCDFSSYSIGMQFCTSSAG